MMMNDGEIFKSYREARNHKKQIKILAELNGCAKTDIETLLRKNGYMKLFVADKDLSVELPKIHQLISCGKSQSEIAKIYGTQQSKICLLLKDSTETVEVVKKKKVVTKKDSDNIHTAIAKIEKLATGGTLAPGSKGLFTECEHGTEMITPVTTNDESTAKTYADLINELHESESTVRVESLDVKGIADDLATVIAGNPVTHPSHYCQGQYECIDVMLETMGVEAVKSFCICNTFKYLFRANKKNGLQDHQKAKWYLDKYLELSEVAGE